MIEALYSRDGDWFVPSAHTAGPWSAGAQHGGPLAALLGRALEALPAASPMSIVRCTIEILRPVPLRRVRVSASVERPGRRVELLAAALHDEQETVLCRASAWRMRRLAVVDVRAGPAVFPPPSSAEPHMPESDAPAFHRTGAELRFVRGSFWDVGPSAVWIRLRRPVVEGETPSPLMRALAAADFGNGVSSALEWGRFVYINTDLTVYLHREPAGEWVLLDAVTHVGPAGTAVAESALHDAQGRIGRSLQAVLVDENRNA